MIDQTPTYLPPSPLPAESIDRAAVRTSVAASMPADIAAFLQSSKIKRTTKLRPTDTRSAAGSKILLRLFLQMLSNEHETRLGTDIEGVHQMRVATRKMRSVIRLFRRRFSPAILKALGRNLKKTAGLLGAVRDLDVFMERVERTSSPSIEPARVFLLESLQKAHAERRKELLRWLDGRTYAQFVSQSVLALGNESGLYAQKSSPIQTEPVLYEAVPLMIYRSLNAVYEKGAAVNPGSYETFHELRIECKRLRYCLEFFEEVLGSDTEEVIERIKKIQDALGELNDYHSLIAAIGTMTAAAEREVPHEFLEKYVLSLNGRMDRIMQRFPRTWRSFRTAETHRLLLQSCLSMI